MDATKGEPATRESERENSVHTPSIRSSDYQEDENISYAISQRISSAAHTQLYQREPDEPLYRRLRVFALNPGVSRYEYGYATIDVPYEPLAPGPVGSVIEVSNKDADGHSWSIADLDDIHVIMQDGYQPSMSDPRFHQQMVYAIAMLTYDNFRVALGRQVSWSFDRWGADGSRNRLSLRPHGDADVANAWYDKNRGEIVFGYFKSLSATPVVKKGEGNIFTCVSQDVIVHEVTHALLDGLRPHFMRPSHPDVLAFHEAFADLIAVFQHFSVDNVVKAAIGKSRGKLAEASVLVDLAQEFGRGIGNKSGALRTFVNLGQALEHKQEADLENEQETDYDKCSNQPHQRGELLSSAVFAAFLTIYDRRVRRFVKMATGDTGLLSPGDLPATLQSIMAEQVKSIARQFMTICIRAIDYCPPVDIRFGDYLRALITADADVVPDDKLGYREAFIQAFGQRGIYGEGVLSMTEEELLWHNPVFPIAEVKELSFGAMNFDGDPARPVDELEMRRQAGVIGRLVTEPRYCREFGTVVPGSDEYAAGNYDLPVVESVRSSRRVGPDREVVFDTVAEVIQERHVVLDSGLEFTFYGGCTIVFGPTGNVRFIVRKRVNVDEFDVGSRLNEQRAFMESENGAALWETKGSYLTPCIDIAQKLCMS